MKKDEKKKEKVVKSSFISEVRSETKKVIWPSVKMWQNTLLQQFYYA